MADKEIGVFRVPGDPNPWEQDDPPWLDGWDTVGPVAKYRPPMWTEGDLGLGKPRRGLYQTIADGLGALLHECGRMHRKANRALDGLVLDYAPAPPGGRRVYLTECDEKVTLDRLHQSALTVPSGWVRGSDGWWIHQQPDGSRRFGHHEATQDVDREGVQQWAASNGLPPLPDEAFKASAQLRWVRGHLHLGGRLVAAILKHPDNRHTIWLRPGESAEYRSTTAALLAIREAFPDAPPCPPEIIREVMAARGEVPDAG